MNKEVLIIKPNVLAVGTKNNLIKKKRVCAYARVSTDEKEQKNSYDSQVNEFTKRINDNPEWDLVKVFADEGISGTSTKNRTQFNEMMEMCRNKEIDLILTKSVSRFARNTVITLSLIQELRTLNVEIFFEKENIWSSDPKVDFMLTIMSSIAQEEARNVSENVKWNVNKRFRDGVPVVNCNRFLGYTKDRRSGNLIVDPEQAKIVKEIFSLYINQVSTKEIIKIMESNGYLTGAGKSKWTQSTIHCILKNEKYVGDLLSQKTVTKDYLTHTRVKNKDLAPMYLITDNHEAIISREDFQKAKEIRDKRCMLKTGFPKDVAKHMNRYPLSGRVLCFKCGRVMQRRHWNHGTKAERVMQQCCGYIEGIKNCDAKAVRNELLEKCSKKLLTENFLLKVDCNKRVNKILNKVLPNETATSSLYELENKKQTLSRELTTLVEMKLKAKHHSEFEVIENKYNNTSNQLDNISKEIRIRTRKH